MSMVSPIYQVLKSGIADPFLKLPKGFRIFIKMKSFGNLGSGRELWKVLVHRIRGQVQGRPPISLGNLFKSGGRFHGNFP